jgi:methionyl-tRNA formyltransferase
LRTVYLGTSDFAAQVLGILAGGAHRPALVITRPDRRRGRGRRMAAPPVAELARELELESSQPDDVNATDARARIAATRPDAVIVCAFGALIREPLLSDHPFLNVHPSLLPRWRGAAPVERAIMAGDEQTGVSIMRLTAGLDAGPVCLQEPEPIRADDTFGTLAGRLARLGGELLVRALDDSPAFTEQATEGVTYAEKIAAAERRLDPARPAADLERVVRALAPHIGARLELPDGTALGIRAAAVTESGPPAGGYERRDERLLLGCAEGALELLEVQPPGGRPMDAADYLHGHGVPRGDHG